MIGTSTLWLMFVLGLRHGLDPDHVAVIDNIVFRAVDDRPRLAQWTGTLFALGHSLSFTVVAVFVSLAAEAVSIPEWIGPVVDGAVIALLLLVGVLNLSALLRRADYTPVGWRAGLVPLKLRNSTHPLAILGIGVIFGLVFDTATQAAAWGAVAATKGGAPAALLIAAAFAAGMLIADTLDSQIVGRLLRTSGRTDAVVRRYRRGVGWVVVGLSFGMAGYGLAETSGLDIGLSDRLFTALGIVAAGVIIILLVLSRWIARSKSA